MIVVLMGVSGSGKTAVGRALAASLGWRFLDADDLHPPANVAKMRAGIPLEEADRAPWIDALAGAFAAARAEGEALVVAYSGLIAAHRTRLAAVADVRWVWLDPTPELLESRLAARVGHFMPPALLGSQLAAMQPPSDAVRVSNAGDVAATVQAIRAAFGV